MQTVWKGIVLWWNRYKNIAAVRGLLQWLDLWPAESRWLWAFRKVVTLIIAGVTFAWARISGLAPVEQFVLSIGALAGVLTIIRVAKRNGALKTIKDVDRLKSGSKELSADEVAIKTLQQDSVILACIDNRGLHHLRGYRLILTDLQEFSPEHNSFCDGVLKQPFLILDAKHVPPKKSSECAPLVSLVEGTNKTALQIVEFPHTRGKSIGAGTWRLQLLIKAESYAKTEACFVSWLQGENPSIVSDPRKT